MWSFKDIWEYSKDFFDSYLGRMAKASLMILIGIILLAIGFIEILKWIF